MDAPSLLKMGLTLALLLAVPAALLWLLRRTGLRLPGQAVDGARLRIVARTAVDAKHVLLLVRRDAQEQLLLLGPSGPTVLESAIKLSREDRAEQRRRRQEETERAAAVRAAADQGRERLRDLCARLCSLVGALRSRVASAMAPSFARLVDRHVRPVRAPAAKRAARRAPAGRPCRPRALPRSA